MGGLIATGHKEIFIVVICFGQEYLSRAHGGRFSDRFNHHAVDEGFDQGHGELRHLGPHIWAARDALPVTQPSPRLGACGK